MRSTDETKASFRTVTLLGAKVAGQVSMTGANVDGDLDADSLQVGDSLLMYSRGGDRTRFKNVSLRDAKITGRIDMSGVSADGDLDAEFLQVAELYMRSEGANIVSFNNVVLRNAKVAGQIDLSGASVIGNLDARSLQAGDVFMRSYADNKARFNNVVLRSAKIAGQIDLSGASVEGELSARSLQVADLFMRSEGANKAVFKNVILSSAKITGQLLIVGASVDALEADSLQVGGLLILRSDGADIARFQTVDLQRAQIGGHIDMEGASVGDLDADSLQVGGSVLLRSGDNKAAFKNVVLYGAKIEGDLDITGAKVASLDLGRSSIFGELRLGDESSWAEPDDLDLRYAHVGGLTDNMNAWPKHGHLQLEGFTFGRLGSFGTERNVDWWDCHWARLDDKFSPAPYEQLAAVFMAEGDHDAANQIHYLEQLRADENATGWDFFRSRLARWVAGYEIGSYIYRVLLWALALSILGAAILKLSVLGVSDNRHGFLWCLGASANHLLPGVTLKKEFADFLDDPKLNKFTPRQDFFFTVLAAVGYALAGYLLAAWATLSHGS
jgi:uncharacterized protein YjbI with pentapeptide repeats